MGNYLWYENMILLLFSVDKKKQKKLWNFIFFFKETKNIFNNNNINNKMEFPQINYFKKLKNKY